MTKLLLGITHAVIIAAITYFLASFVVLISQYGKEQPIKKRIIGAICILSFMTFLIVFNIISGLFALLGLFAAVASFSGSKMHAVSVLLMFTAFLVSFFVYIEPYIDWPSAQEKIYEQEYTMQYFSARCNATGFLKDDEVKHSTYLEPDSIGCVNPSCSTLCKDTCKEKGSKRYDAYINPGKDASCICRCAVLTGLSEVK